MKQFIYCESTEGGMQTQTTSDLKQMALYGWMNKSCKKDDEALLNWAETCEVGEYFEHRLGVCVRLKDQP